LNPLKIGKTHLSSQRSGFNFGSPDLSLKIAMTSGQPKRKRGVVLTPTGRQKLQDAIKAWEEQDNFGDKLTIEELSDRSYSLSP
jgi:hypothetical protein